MNSIPVIILPLIVLRRKHVINVAVDGICSSEPPILQSKPIAIIRITLFAKSNTPFFDT